MDCSLNSCFSLRIYRCRRFVQNNNLSIMITPVNTTDLQVLEVNNLCQVAVETNSWKMEEESKIQTGW